MAQPFGERNAKAGCPASPCRYEPWPVTQSLPAGCALDELTVKGDARGRLVALEQGREVPFDIARVYYVYATEPGVARGFHAHRRTRQYAVAVSGSCTMLLDDGQQRAELWLDRPDRGLFIPPMVWHEMHDFSPDCVLLVLADALYDEMDYIREYRRFRELLGQ